MVQVEANAASSRLVAVDLVYTTTTACHLITKLPSSNAALITQLLPATAAFQGNLQLSKAASGDGCTLYLTMKGVESAITSESYDIFSAAQSVHEQLKELLSTKELANVALARATVELDGKKLLAASLSTESWNETPQSVLTIQQGACTEILSALKSEDDTDLLPRQVETNALNVIKQARNDKAADCAVKLDIAALVPCLSSDVEIFQLLQAVDKKMDSFIAGQPRTTLAGANVRLLVASEELKVVTAKSDDVITFSRNLPSYGETMGIIALAAVLVAMLMGVVVQKKRHDKHSRDQYERASRAAQIRRVAIRMSQRDHGNQEYEGEEDTLL